MKGLIWFLSLYTLGLTLVSGSAEHGVSQVFVDRELGHLVSAEALSSEAKSFPEVQEFAGFKSGDRGVETLHIVAHGAPGLIRMNGEEITLSSLSQYLEGAADQGLREIVIWSCEVGQDVSGMALLEASSGARVYAARGILRGGEASVGASDLRTTDGEQYQGWLPFDAKALSLYSGTLALVSVPFDDGFVGDNTKSNESSNVIRLDSGNSLGWTNIQFSQDTSATDANGNPIFEAQGNDIIGNVLITDSDGTEHSIGGFVKWRAPSGNDPHTVVFQSGPTSTILSTTSGTYTIDQNKYIGLTRADSDPPITGGEVTGNAATSSVLDGLNAILASIPRITIANATVSEGDGTISLVVTLNQAATSTVTVLASSVDGTAFAGSDYTAITEQLVSITAGQTIGTVTISITDDSDIETGETFSVVLTDSTGASIVDNEGVVTVVDNDSADVTAPDAPLITNVTETSSDPDPSDLYSDDNTQILTVTGESGATLKVYTDLFSLIPVSNYAVSETSGTYTVNFGSYVLSDGDYYVTLTDAAGNESASSNTFTIDTSALGAPTVVITEDANDDGFISFSELSGTIQVEVTLPGDAMIGDILTTTDWAFDQTYTLDATDISTTKVILSFTSPGGGNTIAVTAYVTDAAGNKGADGSDSAVLDLSAPVAPVITNVTETASDPDPNDLYSDDNTQVLTVTGESGASLKVYTSGGALIPVSNYAVSETSGTYTVNFGSNVLSDGDYYVTLTDAAGNESASSNTFTIDTSAPSAPTVVITEDTDNDGVISSSELSGAIDVEVTLPGNAVAGDVLTITDGTTPRTITLDATDISNTNVSTTFTSPGDGNAITVTAYVIDTVGNQGADASDSAVLDTSGPAAPTVVITEDADNDGVISGSELSGAIDVTVTLPGGLSAGDVLTITDGTSPQSVTLTSGMITTGSVATTFTSPGDGNAITVTAYVTDTVGNQGADASDSAVLDTTGPAAPTVVITEDADNDGVISGSELSGAIDVTVTLPGGLSAGDVLTITDGTSPQSVTLTSGMITTGSVATTFTSPVDGNAITVTAYVTDAVGNQGADASDSAVLDTSGPAAPTVVIAEDANNDGIISGSELSGAIDVTVTLPGGLSAGDVLTITDGSSPQSVTLTSGMITTGSVATTFTSPGDGNAITVTAYVTDTVGNQGADASDSAVLDTSGPAAPTVVITEDADNDGVISGSELSGAIDVTVTLPGGLSAGDVLTITDGTSPQSVTLTSGMITTGSVATTFTSPGDGNAITVTAYVTDTVGNQGADASDSAVLDTTGPAAPTVVITEDADNDGVISGSELSGAIDVTVTLPGDAVVGDVLTITDGTTPQSVTLDATDISNTKVTTTFTSPGDGNAITVTAYVTDTVGNAGASASDSAVLDTSGPAAPTVVITEDADNDSVISGSELSGAIDVTVALPSGLSAGDVLTITDGTSPQSVTLTSGMITAGSVTTTFTSPGDGNAITVTTYVTDAAGNQGADASDSAVLDTSGPAAPTVVITEDADDDGMISGSELSGAIDVTVALPSGLSAGDVLTITDGTSPQSVTLTSGMITAGSVTTTFTSPGDGNAITVTAYVTDAAGNQGADASDSAVLDTSGPAAPTVVITEDADDDGMISGSELSGVIDVTVTLPSGLSVGDVLTITDGSSPQSVTLTSGMITTGSVATTFTSPVDGNAITVTAHVTDTVGNQGADASDSAVLDTTGPAAPTVVITEDADNDGVISGSELSGAIDVTVTLPSGLSAGDVLTITDGSSTQSVTLTSGMITAGSVTTTFTSPGDGNAITVTAYVTDAAGNQGADASDSAVLDTSGPAAPTVVITEDADDDGMISGSELSGAIDVTVTLPSGLSVGDVLTITDGTSPQSVTLTSEMITAGSVATTFASPGDGNAITVTAYVTDAVGNQGADASDSALLDLSGPVAPIITNVTETLNDPEPNDLNSDDNTQVLTVTGESGATLKVFSIFGTLIAQTNYNVSETAGTYTVDFGLNILADEEYFVTLTDAVGNESPSSNSFRIDTTAPPAPIITDVTETGSDPDPNDLYSDDNTQVVTVTGEAGAVLLIYSIDGTLIPTSNYSVTATVVVPAFEPGLSMARQRMVATPATYTVNFGSNVLADGEYYATLSDPVGNESRTSNTFTIDTTGPAAPTVVITEDTDNDGIISGSELFGAVDVMVNLPLDALAEDILTITDGISPQNVTLTSAMITTGSVATTFASPGDGNAITVTAYVTDAVGNQGASASDSAVLDTSGPAAPTVVITEDADNDGIISGSELSGAIDVTVALPPGALAGDVLTILSGSPPQTVTLTSAMIALGSVATSFASPGDGNALTVTAYVTDSVGNEGANASDSAILDTIGPAAPTVVITEDADNDGIISGSELSGAIDVTVNLPIDALLGDVLTVTNGSSPQTFTLTNEDINAGSVATTFAAPSATIIVTAYVTDAAGNQGSSADDSAALDLNGPTAPTVVITEDADNDGVISGSELSGVIDVRVDLPVEALVGDTLTVTNGPTPQTYTLSAAQISSGKVTTNFVSPGDGNTISVIAYVTDAVGNQGASASDSATLDLTGPGAPVVVVTEDANNDGIISSGELSGVIDVRVNLPADAVVGNVLSVTNGVTPQNITLTASHITFGFVLTSFASPGDGNTIMATAYVSDAVGNPGSSASDSALLDLTGPGAPVVVITEDANNDGIISSGELSGVIDVRVNLPADAVVGNVLSVTNGVTPQNITLTASHTPFGFVSTSFASPGDGNTITVTAYVSDAVGNPGSSASDSALLDLTGPGAPVVVITEDANNDGIISSGELSGVIDVRVNLPADAVVGNVLSVTTGVTPQNITLTASHITFGFVLTSFASPGDGNTITVTAYVSDAVGNPGSSASDSATLDLTGPGAPVVVITEDANNDGIISSGELSGVIDVRVNLPADAVVGNVLSVTNGVTPQNITLTASHITFGFVSTSFASPGDGNTITVTAYVLDAVGNEGTNAEDSADLDLSGPAAPEVVITEDANNDAIISASELEGAIDVRVNLPADAVVGDTLTITNGSAPQAVTLSASNIASGFVTTSFPSPGDGNAISVTAYVTDVVGNEGVSANDIALLDLVGPPAPAVEIIEDANNDAIISASELEGAIDVLVTLLNAASEGDVLTVTDGKSPQTVTLTNAQIAGGSFATTFASPGDGNTITVTVYVTDVVGNQGASSDDSALLDLSGPAAPEVVITEDANNDGVISGSELSGAIDVRVNLPADAVAGDTLTITNGSAPQSLTLTAANIASQFVETVFDVPTEGAVITVVAFVTDTYGNQGEEGADSAALNATGAAAPVVTITEDANNDAFISAAELSGAIDVAIALPDDVEAGDTLKVSDGTTEQQFVLSLSQVNSGMVSTQFASPGHGKTITVVAFVVDQVGNQGSSGTDTATLDLIGPVAPQVIITEDANNDGFLSIAESDGPLDVVISLPPGAKAGDILTVVNGSQTQTFILEPNDIASGELATQFEAPANDETMTVIAYVTDQLGNKGEEGQDSVVADLLVPDPPIVTITEDLNDDGLLGVKELSGPVNVSIQLPPNAQAGDVLTVSGPSGVQTIPLTPSLIASGTVPLEFDRPTDGEDFEIQANITDSAGNTGPDGSDAVRVDVLAPSAPVVTILEDINDDGLIASAEYAASIRIHIMIPDDAVSGDILVVTINGNPTTVVIDVELLATGHLQLTTPALASDETLEVEAVITDAAGNASDSGSDAVTFDLAAPEPPTVEILEDRNGDGWLDDDEIDGSVNVKIRLPAGARAGDKLVVSNGEETIEVELSEADIASGEVLLEFAPPERGAAISIDARITDAAGNTSESTEDTALREPDPANDALRTFRGKDFGRYNLREFLNLSGDIGDLSYSVRSITGLPEGASVRIEGDYIYFDGVSELPGTVSIVLEAVSPEGARYAGSLRLEVEEVPSVDVTDGLAVLSRQTGLFEQRIQVTNTSTIDIDGFEIAVQGMPDGVSLYNASRLDADGLPHVAYAETLAPGETVQFFLEYFTLNRSVRIAPEFVFVLGTEIPEAIEGTPLASVRVEVLSAGRHLLDFDSEPGNIYAIQYSDDLETWNTVYPSVMAAGNRVFWIDEGPPKTRSAPTADRYYRVILID